MIDYSRTITPICCHAYRINRVELFLYNYCIDRVCRLCLYPYLIIIIIIGIGDSKGGPGGGMAPLLKNNF